MTHDRRSWDVLCVEESLVAIESVLPLLPEDDRRTVLLHSDRIRKACDLPMRSKFGRSGSPLPVGHNNKQ